MSLILCAACGVHASTVIGASGLCPHCHAPFKATRAPKLKLRGRSAALAAGLLAFGTFGCDTEEGGGVVDSEDAEARDANEGTGGNAGEGGNATGPDQGAIVPLYGIPPTDDANVPVPTPDMGTTPEADAAAPDLDTGVPIEPDFELPVPAYGIPPGEDAFVPPDEKDMAVPVPLYGIPPAGDAFVPPPADDAAVPVPLYGIPPQGDAAVVEDAEVESDAGIVMPLYGIPPANQ